MQKDKLTTIRDYIVKNSKFLFPVILIAVVAVTVSFALNAGNKRDNEEVQESVEESSVQPEVQGLQEEATPEPEPEQTAPEEAALAVNEDESIHALIAQYYGAMASGDSTVMAAVYDEISENDLLRYEETAKYLSAIPAMDIYTKPGLEKGNTVVYVYYRLCFLNHEEQEIPGWQTFYVCDNGQGGLYIKNELNFTEEEKEYIVAVSAQDDVVEFNNRVSVEYNELATEHPELLTYMGELGKQVNATIGVRLAEQNAAGENSGQEGDQPAEGTPQEGEQPGEGEPQGEGQPAEGEAGGEAPAENPEGGESQVQPEAPAELGPRYATATTTVNVRSSDSEQADKLGKVAGGDRVQVQEVRVNGWSKIVFEGGDGYIKSEYLHMEESADGQQVIGTVTANENVRIRSAASEEGAQLGLMVGGDSLELLAVENGWCKVIYDGNVGYVKADYVTQQ